MDGRRRFLDVWAQMRPIDIPSSAWLLTFFENREFIALVWKPDAFPQPSGPKSG